jgi:hypothetical protein
MAQKTDLVVEAQTQALDRPDPNPNYLLLRAIEKGGIDVPVLERIMDLKFRYDADLAKKEFLAAMADFQADPGVKLFKNRLAQYEGRGGQVSYGYPSLDECVGSLGPELAKRGIVHNWEVAQKDGDERIYVTAVLTHRAGHRYTPATLRGLPDATGNKSANQAIVSTCTMLERATFLAACGMAAKDQPQGERFVGDHKLIAPETFDKKLDPKIKEKTVVKLSECPTMPELESYWKQVYRTTYAKAMAMGDIDSANALIAAKDARKAELTGRKATGDDPPGDQADVGGMVQDENGLRDLFPPERSRQEGAQRRG